MGKFFVLILPVLLNCATSAEQDGIVALFDGGSSRGNPDKVTVVQALSATDTLHFERISSLTAKAYVGPKAYEECVDSLRRQTDRSNGTIVTIDKTQEVDCNFMGGPGKRCLELTGTAYRKKAISN